jgi:hypothetical protein
MHYSMNTLTDSLVLFIPTLMRFMGWFVETIFDMPFVYGTLFT